ncbi:MFS transporter [Naumannella sp. ID2617S]|uniref:MFS transporter n=1 Tax=Enemella dayhoffiae TaxID=2016507 RepID=A0A255GVK6_9ACTN|nr:MFS transporter [Enemella dayhoffiae]NNG20936.1 MFS transporter [Naumannella sp. ID2617S]OYO18693.1 MFS transporter [Enemella dayhoffiae]
MPPAERPFPGHRPGDPAYRWISVSLFLAGVATFALLYAPQPLLPELAQRFGVGAATATLSVSVTTLGLGVALLLAGPGTELVGRTPLMHASLFASSLVGIGCAFAPSWEVLLVLRGLQGFALAGLPAVATAYLREEVHPTAAARATGLYIGGTALGGMSGRLIGGAMGDLTGWRGAFAAIGAVGLACAVVTWLLLPRSQNFRPVPARAGEVLGTARRVLTDPALLALYGISGCLMGGFVAVYNAMGFRLAGPPFSLPLTLASLVFLTYAVGSFSSSYAGTLADRHGQRVVVPLAILLGLAGLALTLPGNLIAVLVGLTVFTAGFFAAHGVASGWVAARAALGGGGTGQAASLYLFAYYLGSSVFGSLSGVAWTGWHWTGVSLMVGGLWVVALLLGLLLRRIPRLPG